MSKQSKVRKMTAGPGSTGKRLVIKTYHIRKVSLSSETAIANETLLVRAPDQGRGRMAEEPQIVSASVSILEPGCRDVEVETILDVIPIATKVLGRIGEGITHVLTGVTAMLTVADAGGRPPAQIGSSAGLLSRKFCRGRAGTPADQDFIILFQVILSEGAAFTRGGILAAHRFADRCLQEIRSCLKKMDGRSFSEKHIYVDSEISTKKKIFLVKLLAGQGALHDNLLLPIEPCGIEGGRSIIDLGNMPVLLSPNEYRDGALRALT